MREIKFRAWFPPMTNQGIGTMSEEVFIDTNEINSSIKYLEKEKTILLQFTGLKDKNGKEIYEGDIVKGKFNNIGVMEWEEKNACFTRFYPLCDFEVIGNIFENPELIN